jgi:hypothetical protein
MSCGPAFNEFADFAVAHPEFDYGVHLVLTCDLPEQPWGTVSRAGVQTLVDDRGIFPEWPLPDLDVAEAEAELRAQIDKAIATGIQITHLDHHMWVMFDSVDLLRLYVTLGRDYRLPIRFSGIVPRQVRQRGSELVQRYLEEAGNLKFRGFPLLSFVESDNYSIKPAEKREYFIRHCRDLPTGICEYVVHCALPAGPVVPPDFAARQADTRFWASEEAAECLKQGSIQPTSWKALMGSGSLLAASRLVGAYSTRYT